MYKSKGGALGVQKAELSDPLIDTQLMLSAAVARQKEREAEAIVEAALSDARIDRFKNSILNGWAENASIRQLTKEKGIYSYGDVATPGTTFFGMNVREPKEAYIEQNETPIDQFGEHVGQAIARGENDFVLNKIADGPIEQVQVRRDSELGESFRRDS
jgi:hypothetical protein